MVKKPQRRAKPKGRVAKPRKPRTSLAALRASERRFRSMADAAPVLIWMSGPDKGCTWFNRPWLEFTGRTLKQEQGSGWVDGLHPEDLARCLDIYTSHFDRRAPFSMEYRLRRHDGVYRWFVDAGKPLQDEAGVFTGYIGSCTDITDRVVAEASVRENEARLALAVRGGDLALWDWDVVSGRIVFNERWAQMLGYSLDEVAPHVSTWEGLVHPDDLPGVRVQLDAHLRGETPSYSTEHRLRHKHGHWVWVLDSGVVVERRADGAPLRAAGTHLDISARVRAEEERRQLLARSARAERAAALGSMAASMSHEFNNPLAYVLAGIDYVQEQLRALPQAYRLAWQGAGDGSLAEVEEALADAADGARRVRDLVADLRAFVVGQRTLDARCDLPTALGRAGRVAHHAYASGSSLVLDLPLLPAVRGSEAELVQLFGCLLVNAGQAKGEGANQVRVTAAREGPNVVVRVSDTGAGIPPEVLPRVFDPFFTTRDIGQGKGLGLSVAFGIAQGLGGGVELESAPGKGTTVIVTLPVAG
jgi:PAS domain S-box-containing protein